MSIQTFGHSGITCEIKLLNQFSSAFLEQGHGTGSLSYPLNKTGVERVICPMQGYLSHSHLATRFRKQR